MNRLMSRAHMRLYNIVEYSIYMYVCMYVYMYVCMYMYVCIRQREKFENLAAYIFESKVNFHLAGFFLDAAIFRAIF